MRRRLVLIIASVLCVMTLVGSTHNTELKVCDSETCLRTTNVNNIEKKEDVSLVDYISLVFTITVPVAGLFWWIINSQQEKKMLEFAQKQEDEFRDIVQQLLEKQEQNVMVFTQEMKELNKKIDVIAENFSTVKLDYMENLYKQNEKIATITSEFNFFKKYIDKVDNIEGYLHKANSDYIIRK